MARSRKPSSQGTDLVHYRDRLAFPSRTPGSLGVNDAADPNQFSLLGDTPGSLGVNDYASPERLKLPGLKTLDEWLLEASVHIEPQMQVGYYYPAGNKEEVLDKAFTFLVKAEDCPLGPYLPAGGDSGITIGVGYDLGQHSESEFRKDWAELGSVRTSLPKVSLGVDLTLREPSAPGLELRIPPLTLPNSKLFSALDRLAMATRGKLSRGQLRPYLQTLLDIVIPRELSLKIHRNIVLAKVYADAAKALTGFTELPTGVQVALLSIVFNRGSGDKHGKKMEDDILDTRWEMKELRTAVLFKDLVWIYWYVESMRRVWAGTKDRNASGLIKRKNDELTLIYPYVAEDLRFEAMRQRYGF